MAATQPMMCVPPSYVTGAIFENNTGDRITLDVTFQSKDQEGYIIESGQSTTVEKTIDHGSWTGSDPITSFKVVSASNQESSMPVTSPGGVVKLKYNIGTGRCGNGPLEISMTELN